MVSYTAKFIALEQLIERNRRNIDKDDLVAMKKIIQMFGPFDLNPCEDDDDDHWKASYIQEMDEDGFVPFNTDRRLGQNQYAARHLNGMPGYENLTLNYDDQIMRFKGLDGGSYHDIKIHISDLDWLHYNFQQLREGVCSFPLFEEK